MLSTNLISMISSYFTSLLRIPASRTIALAVVQAARLIMPSLLHISSANERSSVALRSSSGMVGPGVEELQSLDDAADEAADELGVFLDRVETNIDGGIGVGTELLRDVVERLAPEPSADALGD